MLQTKLKKGDEVIVIAGKDKGKKGKISAVMTATSRVVVAGINMVKKHVSPREAMRLKREPGVMEKEMPIAISNVMLADPKTGKPTRVAYQMDDKGNKVRVAKASGTTLDTIKKAAGAAKAASSKTTKAKK
ncbi:MAG: 50S ribosomal protein L24 [Alphaproteobacteria bacterium]